MDGFKVFFCRGACYNGSHNNLGEINFKNFYILFLDGISSVRRSLAILLQKSALSKRNSTKRPGLHPSVAGTVFQNIGEDKKVNAKMILKLQKKFLHCPDI